MKLLIYTLLSLLGFATLVAVLRIYGLVEQDLNNIIFNWLLTISPIILAVAAFWSIWENRRIRKVDRELEMKQRKEEREQEFKRHSLDNIQNWT